MAEPDAPQFSDRSTPEPLDDLELQAPLLVAPPLGINRQFLVPLGARSLTVLEPDLFQPRSSHTDSSLFGDSPFFHDPLLAALPKPAAQPLPSQSLPSSADGLSSSLGESVQRSPISPEPPTVSIQPPADYVLRSQSSTPLMGSMNQPDRVFEPTVSQHSDQFDQHSVSAADGLAEISHDQPGQPTARRDVAQAETPSFEPPQASAASTEELTSQQTLPFKDLSRAPTIEPADPSIPLLANEVQRSTKFEASSESINDLGRAPTIELTDSSIPLPANEIQRSTKFETPSESIAETGSALAVDSQPHLTVKPEAASVFISKTEQMSAPKVESAFTPRSEQISASIVESAPQSIPDSHSEAAVDFKPEAVNRSGVASTFEPASLQRAESTTEARSIETAELTSSAEFEASSDPKSELAGASPKENFGSIASIQEQAPVVSPSTSSDNTSSIQRSQPLQSFGASTSTAFEKPETITDQAAQDYQSIALPEQQEHSLEESVQRSLNVESPTFIHSNELAQKAAERLDAGIDHSAIEALTTQTSTIEAAGIHQAQSSSTAFVSDTASDNSTTIASQSKSLLSPTSSPSLQPKELQAKELEPSPQTTIGSSGDEQYVAPHTPSAPLLAQPHPSLALEKTSALAELELQAKPQAISESTPQTSQASLELELIPSTDRAPLDQATPSLTSDIPQPAQVLPTSEAKPTVPQSPNQPPIEASLFEPHGEDKSRLEVLPSPAAPLSSQSDLQRKSTEVASELTSASHPLTFQNGSLESLPDLDAEQRVETLHQAAPGSSESHNQLQNLVERSPIPDHSAEALPSTTEASDNIQAASEVSLQRTSIASLESSVSTEESIVPEISGSQSFNSQSLSLQRSVVSNAHQNQSIEPKAKATQPDLANQTLVSLESNEEAFKANISAPDTTANSGTSSELASEQNLSLDQANFTDGTFINSASDSNSIPDSQSKPSLIQAKSLTTSEGDSSESVFLGSVFSETSKTSGIESTSALDSKASSVSIQSTAESSSPLREGTGNLDPLLDLNIKGSELNPQNLNKRNLEIQHSNALIPDQKSLATQTLETQSLQAKRSEAEKPEIHNSDTSDLELPSKSEAVEQSGLSLLQPEIDTESTEITDSSVTIARTLNTINQSVDLSKNTVGLAHPEAQSAHPATNPISTSLGAISSQDIAQHSINESAVVNLNELSHENIALKRDEPGLPLQSFDLPTQETLPKAHTAYPETNLIATKLDTVSSQDIAQHSIDDQVAVNLSELSNESIAPKRDESGSPLQLFDALTQETLPKAPESEIAATSQSFLLQQPEPQKIHSELEKEQSRSVSVDGENVLSSDQATMAQRSLEASTASSNATTDNATFDPSITGVTEPLSAELTEPLPHTQDLPEARSLPDLQSLLPSPSDDAVVQAQFATQAPLPSEIDSASKDVASSVAPVNEMPSDTVSNQAASLMNHGTIAHSTTVMRSLDSSLPELEAPSSLESPPALPLVPEQQEHLTSHNPAETFSMPSQSSEQGNETDRYRSSESNAAPSNHEAIVGADLSIESTATSSTHEAIVGAGLSIQDASNTDTPTPHLQRQATQTDAKAQATIANAPTSSPSFAVEASIQRQVTPLANAASQPLAADLLDTQHSESFTSPQVTSATSLSGAADQPLAADSSETQHSKPFTSPQVKPLVDALIQPFTENSLEVEYSESATSPLETAETASFEPQLAQNTEPSLLQSSQADLPQLPQQNAPLPSPPLEHPPLQSQSSPHLEDLIEADTSSPAVVSKREPIETTHELVSPAIVQRMPSTGQSLALDSIHASDNAVDNQSTQPEAPLETALDNPADNFSKTGAATTTPQPEAPPTLPLILQPLSTLKPLTASANLSSANFGGRASATAPSVQPSSQSTPCSQPTPAPEQPQSKHVVKVDRPTTQWSGFSDLVQRQVTPSARSSSRSTAEPKTVPHSVAAALASTSEMIQRQETQPAAVRISRDDQAQFTAAEPSQTVDAKDLEQLAQVIYQQLRQRLRIEQERHGRDGAGRLPW